MSYNSIHKNVISEPKSEKPKTTQARQRMLLERFLYFGHGPRYLAQFCSQKTNQAERARWSFEKDRFPRPLLKDPLLCTSAEFERGASCWLSGIDATDATHVPFIAIDLDYHSAGNLDEYLNRCQTAIKVAIAMNLNWSAEINRKNGSLKLFGWRSDPIPIAEAMKMAQAIELTCETDGVFPSKLSSIWLPFRGDKTTIVGDEVCPKATSYFMKYGKRVPYEHVDLIEFNDRLPNRLDPGFVMDQVTTVATNFNDTEPVKIKEPTKVSAAKIVAVKEIRGSESPKDLSDVVLPSTEDVYLRSEWLRGGKDALLRESYLVKAIARKLNSVPSLEVVLKIKERAGCFTDCFDSRASMSRLPWLIRNCAKTFNKRSKDEDTKLRIDKLRKQLELKGGALGRVLVTKAIASDMTILERFVVISKEDFLSYGSSILEAVHCRDENDGVATNYVKKIFESNCKSRWNSEKYMVVRDHLERLKLIDIYDRNHEIGKCWRMKEGGSHFATERKRVFGGYNNSRKPIFVINTSPSLSHLISLFGYEHNYSDDRQKEVSIRKEKPPDI